MGMPRAKRKGRPHEPALGPIDCFPCYFEVISRYAMMSA